MAIIIFFSLFYMIASTIMGFEDTMIIIGATIIGNYVYQEMNEK